MRRIAVAGAVAAFAALGVASPAGAAPKDKTETWVCDGVETEITVTGRVGRIDGQKYLAHNFSIVGTFTPTGGEPIDVSEEKWTTGAEGIDCTMEVEETDEEGTFSAVFSVTAVPIGN